MLRNSRLTLTVIVLALSACSGGCSGHSDGDEVTRDEMSTGPTTKATSAESRKAIGCLNAAELFDVKERELGVWGGLHQDPDYAIVVHKLAKPAKAPRVVAGEYALTGSFKVVAIGTGFGNDGIQADALVQTVAECLSS